jgi:hypothetical protein
MKESPKNIIHKPGLEEALHPEIGNEGAWTTDDHEYSLSKVDPLKSLDAIILDKESTRSVVQLWNTQFNAEPIAPEFTYEEQKEVDPQREVKQEAPLIQEKDETGESIALFSSEESEPQPEIEETDSANKKNKKKKEKAPLKAGKRIRKLADKVKKEEEKRMEENAKISATAAETSLSPFTHWLKGLTGSEYVHPYDDDFAFNQGSSHAGESISETFADLLAAQGYKEQAIAMYTRLMEKFPEKSRFFAAKIEALQ